ncbi:MAG: L-histidine N(alpha)-methyltransferase [Phycisphaeraceae bacterium]
MSSCDEGLVARDLSPDSDDLLRECVAGLRRRPRELPCKFLYDERGAELFERICDLPEYYPTRTELGILEANLGEIAERLGPSCLVVEPGSGDGRKTRILLGGLDRPSGYVPIDIAREQLWATARELSAAHPEMEILPVCADYAEPMELPACSRPVARRVVYFPGSTIGNLHPVEARAFLRRMAELAGPGGAMLIGVDLRKDEATLLAAYNDRAGVTAAFNLNLLDRLNRELGARFEVDGFEHRAVWNDRASRMEMHLVCTRAQVATLGGESFSFRPGESIRTECSYKYTPDAFAELAEGFRVGKVWTDPGRRFSVQYLEVR